MLGWNAPSYTLASMRGPFNNPIQVRASNLTSTKEHHGQGSGQGVPNRP